MKVICARLNATTRKCLDYKTTAEAFKGKNSGAGNMKPKTKPCSKVAVHESFTYQQQ
jgi:hypothetical protein